MSERTEADEALWRRAAAFACPLGRTVTMDETVPLGEIHGAPARGPCRMHPETWERLREMIAEHMAEPLTPTPSGD